MTNPYTYTAREYDLESGLYYYRARYYDASVGRFLQEDPIGFSGGVNFYSYVGNNPVNWIDPWGLTSKKKDEPWWIKLEKGHYFGTGRGQKALEFYAKKWLETENPLWAVPGASAALWTPETYRQIAWTLITTYSLSRLGSGNWNKNRISHTS